MARAVEGGSLLSWLSFFFKRRSGQSEVFSVILIMAVLISLVAAAYFWGIPLVNKRAAIGTYTLASGFVTQLNDKVIKISNSGSGTETIDIPSGSVKVVPYGATDPDNNSIILFFEADQPLALNSSVVYIGATSYTDTGSEIGTYREAQPSVITLTSSQSGTGYVVKVKIHYRELDTTTTPPKGYKIAVDSTKATGSSRVRLTYGTTEVTPGGAGNGGDLVLTRVNVEVV